MFYLLALLFVSAPTYVIRFNIGIPVNLLEILSLAFLLVFAFWLYKNKAVRDFTQHIEGQPRLMLYFAGLFLLVGFVEALVAPNKARGLGLFVALFLEPILIYMPASYILSSPLNKLRMVKFMFWYIAGLGLYGLFQYFTLFGLPNAWWGNSLEPKRALSVFEHPNSFALFLTPLLAFLLPFVFERKLSWYYKLFYLISIAGLVASLSRGGWLGFAAAVAAYILFFATKRVKIALIAAAIIFAGVAYAIPILRYRVILAYRGDKSTESRYSLWHTANKMIKDSPVLGKGLQGFEANFSKYNTDPTQLPINLAHNIFLNFWVETGFFGLLLFVLICLFALYRSMRLKGLLAIGTTLFLIALFTHGMVDNPYLKNDLALVFWIILAFQS
ncbi:MAG: O-antigen polymerase [Candidatus Doudnabacteria bacterium]|nr:O-antigen polymerase [Candidatus Doudnabacteria bacterium]